jgi:hypothetical protein
MNDAREEPVRDGVALERLLEAFREYADTGQSVAECDDCGSVIQFRQLGDEAWQSSCDCGKYSDTFRGI